MHRGFFEYMEVLAPRVNEYRNWLESECGIEIDFITGHSLGGAAATLYADVYGEPLGTNGDHYLGVVTFGAPATHNTEWFRRRLEDYDTADLDCDTDDNDCIGCIATKHRDIQVEGIRFVNADDWVPSGLSGYEHIISHYENSECSEPDGATCDGIEACHILTPGYDWVHKKRFVLPARPSKDLTPRPTPVTALFQLYLRANLTSTTMLRTSTRMLFCKASKLSMLLVFMRSLLLLTLALSASLLDLAPKYLMFLATRPSG